MNITKLHGVGVALITPFNTDLSIDFEGLKKLIHFVSENDSDYLVVQGTTGETSTTTSEEKEQLLRFTIENNPKKLPIVYGLGGNNTTNVLNQIKNQNFEGIDVILSVCPYYNKPSQAGIFAHFTAIANACPVPVILYNVPGRTVVNMSPDTIIDLSAHPNIIGIKDASGSFEQIMEIAKRMPKDFLLISGDDNIVTPMISVGAVGVISVIANAFPKEFAALTHSALAGNFKKAAQIQYQFLSFDTLLYQESNPVGIKQCLAIKNICLSEVRQPLVKASDSLAVLLSKEMKAEGFID